MKKILALLLGTVLLCTSVAFASAAETPAFSDMPDDWSTKALTAAVENGLLNGTDGKILPSDNLTRAQMATIIARAFAAVSKNDLKEFTDVPSDAWYFEYMQKAVAMGVFNGDGSGLLNPNDNITREQVFAVIARAFKLPAGDNSVLDQFSDKDGISEWALPYASALVGNKYINGSNGKINAKNNITRAEFAQVMYNIVKAYIDEGDTLSGTYEGNVIVRADNIKVAKDVKINGKLIVCEGCKGTVIEKGAEIGELIDNSGKVTDNRSTKEDNKEQTGGLNSGNGNSSTNNTGSNTGDNDKEDDWGADVFYPTAPPSQKPENSQNPEDTQEPEDDEDDWTTSDVGWTPVYRP